MLQQVVSSDLLFVPSEYPDYLSPEAVDIISRLLDVDETTRLGQGETGEDDVKNHPFFRGIDFSLLEQKHVEPPYKPYPSILLADAEREGGTSDITEVLFGKHWFEDKPNEEMQKYFATW